MPGTDRDTLTKTEVFEVLQNPRRRYVLRYLAEESGEVTFDDLIDQVAAWENDSSVEGLTTPQRRRVYVSLTQSHLPKLEELGIVRHHEDRGTVERLPRAQRLEAYLDFESSDGLPWPVAYLVVALGGMGVAVLYWLGPVPFTAPASIVLTMGIVVLFLMLSLVQFVRER